MKRSTNRILTSHAGSLPRSPEVMTLNRARFVGEAYDPQERSQLVRDGVADVVRKQLDLGVDIVNDGETGKTSALSYVEERLEGFDSTIARPPATRRDWMAFPGFYTELWQGRPAPMTQPDCVGPLSYKGREQLKEDIDNMKAALAGVQPEEAFITAVAPGWFGRGQIKYYRSEEEFH